MPAKIFSLIYFFVVQQLFSHNAFDYVLPIASFVVAWLETWFLDFKVLTQEAEDERGENESTVRNPNPTEI